MVKRAKAERCNTASESGQTIIMGLVILVLAAIFLPLLIQLMTRESKWTVKNVKNTLALNVAEAAIDKMGWRMKTDNTIWILASSGTVVPGYDNDAVYADVEGGEYKIKLSSGPKRGQVTVLATARDKSKKEVRGVQAIFYSPVLQGPINSSSIQFDNRPFEIHWGPIRVSQGINLNSPTLDLHYPRKFSSNAINPFSVVNGTTPTDGVEYWAYQTDFGQTEMRPDFDYYKARAMDSKVPVTSPNGLIASIGGTSTLAEASPPGSGLFLVSVNHALYFQKKVSSINPGYVFQDPGAVIYYEDEAHGATMATSFVRFGAGVFLDVEAFIVNTDWFGAIECDISFKNGSGNVSATIPHDAPLEYQHPSAQPVWNGAMKGVWQTPGRCCYPINNVMVHGILYSNRGFEFRAFEKPVIVGALVTPSLVYQNGMFAPTLYYDEELAAKFRTKIDISRQSWKSVPSQW